MHRLRRLVLRHSTIAACVIALALAMKMLMPAGFMPTVADGRIVVGMCSGSGQTTMVVTIPGLAQHESAPDGPGDKPAPPCAFAGLSTPTLAATDPALLVVAILFVLALGLRRVVPVPIQAPRSLRPPLRGPPATA